MDPSIILKLLWDYSLWASFTGLIFKGFGLTANGIIPCIAFVVCGTLSEFLLHKNEKLRFIPLVLAATAVFFINNLVDAIFLLPPFVYLASTIALKRFVYERGEFETMFKYAATVSAAALLIGILFGAKEAFSLSIPYLVVFFISGIVLLRVLRQDPATRRELHFILLSVVVPLCACFIALLFSSHEVLGAMGSALRFLYNTIIMPILTLLGYLSYGLVWVLEKLIMIMKARRTSEDDQPLINAEDTNNWIEEFEHDAEAPDLQHVFTALAIIVFLVIAFSIFKKLMGRRSATSFVYNSGEVRSRISAESTSETPLRSIFRPLSPRDTVRSYYARFLKKAVRMGIMIPKHYTTDMIMQTAAPFFEREPLHELNRLYVLARYSPAAITKDDARKARTLYNSIEKKESR